MLTPRRSRQRPAAGMRGLSIVELMVGVAVGLFVVAAAALLVSSQLSDNRRLLLETQLQQDLRATADIVTRELRRASFNLSPESTVSTPDGSPITQNVYRFLSLPGSATDPVQYRYRRGSGVEKFGFRLASTGVIESCQTADLDEFGNCPAYQEMTDRNTVDIREFSITATRAGARARSSNDDAITLPCPNLCADGTTACWPQVTMREVVITITGRSRTDASVARTLNTSVRVRNDRVDLSSEAPAGQACPAI